MINSGNGTYNFANKCNDFFFKFWARGLSCIECYKGVNTLAFYIVRYANDGAFCNMFMLVNCVFNFSCAKAMS